MYMQLKFSCCDRTFISLSWISTNFCWWSAGISIFWTFEVKFLLKQEYLSWVVMTWTHTFLNVSLVLIYLWKDCSHFKSLPWNFTSRNVCLHKLSLTLKQIFQVFPNAIWCNLLQFSHPFPFEAFLCFFCVVLCCVVLHVHDI